MRDPGRSLCGWQRVGWCGGVTDAAALCADEDCRAHTELASTARRPAPVTRHGNQVRDVHDLRAFPWLSCMHLGRVSQRLVEALGDGSDQGATHMSDFGRIGDSEL
jgi:hypothetical protein